MTVRYCDADLGTGNNDGTSWANAYQTLQAAADNAVAGDIVYCQGTDSISARIDFDTNSGTYDGGYIKFVGVKDGTTNEPPQAADYDSGNGDSGYFIIDGQNNNINGIYINGVDMIWLENIKIHSCDLTAGIYTAATYADNWIFNNVWCHDNDGHGIYANEYMRYATYARCKFTSNTGDGIYRINVIGTPVAVICCEFIGNTGDGIDAHNGEIVAVGCLFHGNGAHGIVTSGGRTYLVNCVFDGNAGNGVNTSGNGVQAPVCIGCRFTNHSGSGDVGLAIGGNERAKLMASYFQNNNTHVTASRYDILPIDGSTSHVVLGGTDTDGTNGELLGGYKDIGSDDFNLKDTATLRSQAIELP